MALQGTLETFSVAEVLRLLAGTRKTGCLVLEGDLGTVEVSLTEGRINPAVASGLGVEDAVVHAMRMDSGSFEFTGGDDEALSSPSDTLDVEDVLAGAEQRLGELRAVDSIVPSLDSVLRLEAMIEGESVTVDRDEWALVVAIADRPTAGSLGADLGLDRTALADRLRNLVESGVVVVDAPVRSEAAVAPAAPIIPVVPAPSVTGDWMARDDWDFGLDPEEPVAPVAPVDVSAQAQTLSAKAAAAIEAVTAEASTPEPHVVADRVDGDEDATRGLLLRFLSASKP